MDNEKYYYLTLKQESEHVPEIKISEYMSEDLDNGKKELVSKAIKIYAEDKGGSIMQDIITGILIFKEDYSLHNRGLRYYNAVRTTASTVASTLRAMSKKEVELYTKTILEMEDKSNKLADEELADIDYIEQFKKTQRCK